MNELVTIDKLIAGYFQAVDSALEMLSAKSEGYVAHLPSWTLTTREIRVAYVRGGNAVTVQAIPRSDLTHDSVAHFEVANPSELANVIDGWQFSGPQPDRDLGFAIADLTITPLDDQLAPPIHASKGYMATVTFDNVLKIYSLDAAKDDAINFWNNAVGGFPQNMSIAHNLGTVFDAFQAIIKRKAFKETRIHRFINEHHRALLPEHQECYFEHAVFLNGERRVADFILRHEAGRPATLVELENPSVAMFKKNGELTADANHARNQIAEWARFIEQNPQSNCIPARLDRERAG